MQFSQTGIVEGLLKISSSSQSSDNEGSLKSEDLILLPAKGPHLSDEPEFIIKGVKGVRLGIWRFDKRCQAWHLEI